MSRERKDRRVSRRDVLKGGAALAALGLFPQLLAACASSPAPAPAAPAGGAQSGAGAPPAQSGAAPAVASGAPKTGGTLVYAQAQAVNQADSTRIMLVYPAAQDVSNVVTNKLVDFDAKMKIQPSLAESWEVSQDGLTWTFQLRKGAKFQDGTPFNAQVVQTHWQRLIDPQNPSPNRNLWLNFKEVKPVDEYTVQLVTEKPFAPTLYYIAQEAGGIASPTAIEKHKDNYQRNPVGTGPYMVESFVPGSRVVLKRFDDFWKGKPPLDKIEFVHAPEAQTRLSMLEAGQADVINDISPTDAQRLASNPNLQLLRTQGLRPFWIEFNLTVPLFQDVRVRQALNHAVDKEAIVKNIFMGYAAVQDSPASPAIQGYKKIGVYEYNPDKAKQMLAEAGWRAGANGILQKDGQPFKFTLMTADGLFSNDVVVTEAVQANLKAIGCDVTIQKIEAASYWGVLRKPQQEMTMQACFFGFNPSNGDLGYHLAWMWKSNTAPEKGPTAWNLMWYKNERLDQLLTQADQTVDETKRMELLGEGQKLIWDDAPMIWLYVPDLLGGASKKVQGVFIWPTLFYSLQGAWKE